MDPMAVGTGGPGSASKQRTERIGAPVSERPGRWLSSGRTLLIGGATVLVLGLAAGASPALVRTASAVTPPPGRAPAAAPTGSGSRSGLASVPVAPPLDAAAVPVVAPLRHRYEADVIVVAQRSLPSGSMAAARIQVNGTYVAMIGVNPSSFRSFAARPTASSDRLWQNVAAGCVAVSYDMGKQDRLPLGGNVHVAGRASADLPVGGFAT